MIILLSPAKTLDFENTASTDESTKPHFHSQANRLAEEVGKCSIAELCKLMSVSENLGNQVHGFFSEWSNRYNVKRAKQAIYAFRGDVYRGFEVDTADEETRQRTLNSQLIASSKPPLSSKLNPR
ncbi:MAG: peroxide stress protein YaaA [Lacipirellulaceae bacterium]